MRELTHNHNKKANTRLSCPFLWLDPLSFPWPSISGMFVMMIRRISSLPRTVRNHPRRRDGSKTYKIFKERKTKRVTSWVSRIETSYRRYYSTWHCLVWVCITKNTSVHSYQCCVPRRFQCIWQPPYEIDVF